MGSGGGVPNHATYVTQRIGSGWYFKYSPRSGEVKGRFRDSGLFGYRTVKAFIGIRLVDTLANPLLKLGVLKLPKESPAPAS
jgi:hypothetical protein